MAILITDTEKKEREREARRKKVLVSVCVRDCERARERSTAGEARHKWRVPGAPSTTR